MITLKTADDPQNRQVTAVVANQAGEIFDMDGYAAVGMSGQAMAPLLAGHTIDMPPGSELLYLPERHPILFNQRTGNIETLTENPYVPGAPIFAVAVFNSPGYVITRASAYGEMENGGFLPLFSYGAVGWHRGKFRSAVMLVDSEPRQDLRQMQHKNVVAGVRKLRKQLPENRLRAHLEKCALEYGCPAAKNFFLGRYEAPLPTAQHCNASCLGCLSLQPTDEIPCSQDRIGFTPSAEEISEVALYHIGRVKNSIVSFGQGCEGDPLLAADVIEPAIGLIRKGTDQGTINLNSNGSLPQTVEQLVEAGLDSIRVSMNSVRQDCYEAYFRPRGYRFSDVLRSIEIALNHNKFVSINYLNAPGFTDSPQEVEALTRFLKDYPVSMIQWRNLNFDPLRYWHMMNRIARHGEPIGMQTLIEDLRRLFPHLKHGYFNPPKERFNQGFRVGSSDSPRR